MNTSLITTRYHFTTTTAPWIPTLLLFSRTFGVEPRFCHYYYKLVFSRHRVTTHLVPTAWRRAGRLHWTGDSHIGVFPTLGAPQKIHHRHHHHCIKIRSLGIRDFFQRLVFLVFGFFFSLFEQASCVSGTSRDRGQDRTGQERVCIIISWSLV